MNGFAATGCFTNTGTTAEATVEDLIKLVESAPKLPPFPQKFHDEAGRCYAAIVGYTNPGWDTYLVKVASRDVAKALKEMAEAGGYRIVCEVDPMIALPGWPFPPGRPLGRTHENPFGTPVLAPKYLEWWKAHRKDPAQ